MSREGYKMTELGEMPQEWIPDTLGNCLSKIVGGGTPSRDNEQFYQGEIPWATVKDLDNKFYKDDAIEHITLDAIKNSASNLIPSGTIIVATRMGLGRGFINTAEMAINQDLKALFPKDNIDTRYLLHWFLNQARNIESMGKGSTVKGIRLEELRALPIAIPTFGEQQKIADILSTVDQKIEQTDALIEKTKELKKGLMQKLLTKGIGHTEFRDTEIGRIPKGWEVVPLGKVCSVRSDKYTPSQDEDRKYVALEHMEQETGRLLGVGKSSETTSLKAIFKTGDVLFGKLRPYLKKYYLAEFEGVCATEILPLTVNSKCMSEFLFYIIQQDNFINFTVQGSFGTKMPRTSWGEIKEYLIALPSIQEQKDITDVLYMVDTNLNQYKEKKEKLLLVKSGLMSKLLTGRVRVKI